jgi:hypothetical protein
MVSTKNLGTRVTRECEISALGLSIVYLGKFFLINQSKIFDYFFERPSICIKFDKNGLGYILGDFFTNASGHPARNCSDSDCFLKICLPFDIYFTQIHTITTRIKFQRIALHYVSKNLSPGEIRTHDLLFRFRRR